LTEQEMLAIARAFAWYPNPSASFDGFQDEQMIERYLLLTTSVMKTYCEIYSLDERAYMMISNESSMTPILQYFRLLWGMLWIVGPARVYRQIERGTEAGICQEVELRKKKDSVHPHRTAGRPLGALGRAFDERNDRIRESGSPAPGMRVHFGNGRACQTGQIFAFRVRLAKNPDVARRGGDLRHDLRPQTMSRRNCRGNMVRCRVLCGMRFSGRMEYE